MLAANGTCSLPNAITFGWATPTDDQMAGGVEALAAVVGPELAARASWQRRLVVLPDHSYRLLINECSFLSNGELPQFSPGSVTPIPVAVEIGTAAALLKQPANCETVLAQRQQFLADLAERHRKQELDERQRSIEAGRRQQDAEARAKNFKWDQWAALVPWQQFAYSLALAIDDGEDPSAAMRRIAGSVRSFHGERAEALPPPAKKWW